MDNKVNQFVPEHFFGMKIGNKETYIISFYFFPSQNHEIFSTSHHETSEFMAEQFFNFISLFNSNRHTNTVETKRITITYLFCSHFFSGFLPNLKKTVIQSLVSHYLGFIYLLMEGSISTFSLSFLDIITGFNKSSGDSLTSISGLLCLSTFWEEKFSTHMAAWRVRFTHTK